MAGRSGLSLLARVRFFISVDDQPRSKSSVSAGDPPHHCKCDGDDLGLSTFSLSTGNQKDPPRPSFPRTAVHVGQDVGRTRRENLWGPAHYGGFNQPYLPGIQGN